MKIKIEFKNGFQIIVGFFKNSYKVKVIWHVILNWEVLFNPEITSSMTCIDSERLCNDKNFFWENKLFA